MNSKIFATLNIFLSFVITFSLANPSSVFAVTNTLTSDKDKIIYDRPLPTFKNKSPQVADTKSNAVQPTVASQPMLNSNSIGYLPAAEFDGTNDFLNYDGASLVGSNYTIFIVERRGNNKANNCLIGTNSTAVPASNVGLNICYKTNGSISFAQGSNEEVIGIEPYGSSRSPVLHVFMQDKYDGKKYYRNGVLVFHNATNTAPLASNDNGVIGKSGNAYFNGKVAEIVMFKRALPGNKLEANMDYLLAKWGISKGKVGSACTPSSPGYMDIIDGQWSNNGNAPNGGILSLTCLNGKSIVGTLDPLVCNNGIYSGKGGVCDIVPCTNPPSLANGSWNYTQPVLNGQSITGTCNSGYVGTPTMSCNAGSWGTPTSCAMAPCVTQNVNGIRDGTSLPVALTNTNFTCNETGSKGSITYTCIAGVLNIPTNDCRGFYWAQILPIPNPLGQSGNRVRKGEEIVDWSTSSSICNASRIGTYGISSSGYNPPNAGWATNQFPLKCWCIDPSHIYGKNCGNSTYCNMTGQASGNAVFECRGGNPLPCANASTFKPVTNGVWSSETANDGGFVSLSCPGNFTTINGNLTCSNGDWSGGNGSCMANCTNAASVPITNGSWSSQTANHNAPVTGNCNAGYTKTGSRTLTCNNGTWNSSGTMTCTAPGCSISSLPSLANGNWNWGQIGAATGGDGKVISDTTISATSCYTNYSFTGGTPPSVTCNMGTWSTISGSCTYTSCNNPPSATPGATWNGSLTYPIASGTIVIGYCGGNYSGKATVTCTNGSYGPISGCISCKSFSDGVGFTDKSLDVYLPLNNFAGPYSNSCIPVEIKVRTSVGGPYVTSYRYNRCCSNGRWYAGKTVTSNESTLHGSIRTVDNAVSPSTVSSTNSTCSDLPAC